MRCLSSVANWPLSVYLRIKRTLNTYSHWIMKTLIKILTVILPLTAGTISCTEDKMEKENYTDITGTWKFSNSVISGEIKISKSLTGAFVQEDGLNFKINGQNYQNKISRDLILKTGLLIDDIVLWDNPNFGTSGYEGGAIYFFNVKYSSDFKKLTALGYEFFPCDHLQSSPAIFCIEENMGWGVSDEEMIFTRK